MGDTMQLETTIEGVEVRFINQYRNIWTQSKFGEERGGKGRWTSWADTDGFRELTPYEEALLKFVLPDDIKEELRKMSEHSTFKTHVYLREV